jgi:hypothetical protein
VNSAEYQNRLIQAYSIPSCRRYPLFCALDYIYIQKNVYLYIPRAIFCYNFIELKVIVKTQYYTTVLIFRGSGSRYWAVVSCAVLWLSNTGPAPRVFILTPSNVWSGSIVSIAIVKYFLKKIDLQSLLNPAFSRLRSVLSNRQHPVDQAAYIPGQASDSCLELNTIICTLSHTHRLSPPSLR